MDRLRLASIEITQRCDNLCSYCEQPKSQRSMPVAEFCSLLDSLRAEGFEAVALGGGEPTLHPELRELLAAAAARRFRAGLTTNARDPRMVAALADLGLLESFGVSAGKGSWTELVAHPRATVNLLLLRGGVEQIIAWSSLAIRSGARRLLLMAYKGGRLEFAPSAAELAVAFAMLVALGRSRGLEVAADDFSRRRLGLTGTCGEGFVRIRLDGSRDDCCFPDCEFRPRNAGAAVPGSRPAQAADHPRPSR